MSVINQMLRDLDARDASASERAGLPPRLRTLPPEAPARPQGWLLLAAGMLLGALITWFVLGQQTPSPIEQPVPAPAQPARAAPPAAEPQQSAPAPAAPETAPARKPAPKPSVHPAPVAKAVPAPVAMAAEPAPAGAAHIDKQPKGGASREQAETEYRKGMQAAGSGDNATALPALRRALEIDPQHARARQALLSVLAGSRQWDAVKQVARDGLALDPAKSGWAVILARLLHEQGDTAGAVKTLEAHAPHAAGDADYQGLLAFLLQKSQRPAEAAQRYQAALGLRPGEGRWWYGLGLALEAAGRGDEAKAAFGRARDTGSLPADMLGVIEQKLR